MPRYTKFNQLLAAICFAAIQCMLIAAPTNAIAEIAATPPKPAQDRCLALANNQHFRRPLIHRVTAKPVKLLPYQVHVRFLGHATFLLESPKGVKIATDYAIPIPPPDLPTIATMNIAHSSHFTYSPQSEIKHVLPGWNEKGGPIIHDLTVDDVRVRNVSTNIRTWSGETEEFANSIFIFEIGPLCIAHLGHLHHPLTTQQLANIGQMDVVMAPVDGSFTLDTPGMLEVIKAMNPRLVLPMHYFTPLTLERFLAGAGGKYKVRIMDKPEVVISKDALPGTTEIWVLPGF